MTAKVVNSLIPNPNPSVSLRTLLDWLADSIAALWFLSRAISWMFLCCGSTSIFVPQNPPLSKLETLVWVYTSNPLWYSVNPERQCSSRDGVLLKAYWLSCRNAQHIWYFFRQASCLSHFCSQRESKSKATSFTEFCTSFRKEALRNIKRSEQSQNLLPLRMWVHLESAVVSVYKRVSQVSSECHNVTHKFIPGSHAVYHKSFTHSFTRSFIHPSIHSFIHSFIHHSHHLWNILYL